MMENCVPFNDTYFPGEGEEVEGFKITDDVAAEWALAKIKQAREERDRLVATCESMLDYYRRRKETYEKAFQRTEDGMFALLRGYFDTVPHAKAKASASYKLPSATLRLKETGPDYKRDKDKMLAWADSEGRDDLVKVAREVKWAELKAECKVVDGALVCKTTGSVVGGVEVVPGEPKFIVEGL